MPDYKELTLKLHKEKAGKISVTSKVKVENKYDLPTAYTPDVEELCRVIHLY